MLLVISKQKNRNYEEKHYACDGDNHVPMDEGAYVARPYGFEDAFKGALENDGTLYLGKPMKEWLCVRGNYLQLN